MTAPDNTSLAIDLAVLKAAVTSLTTRADERHLSLQSQLELRDTALQASLERLQDSLSPLVQRVERLERFQAKALGIVAAGTALVPLVTWLADKVAK